MISNSLLTLFIFIIVLVVVLLLLNYLLSSNKPDAEKLSIYECGFSAVYGQTRSTFTINFLTVAMLFLVFDLEIVLFVPVSLALNDIGNYGLFTAILFFLVLTIGFVFEISSGALNLTKKN